MNELDVNDTAALGEQSARIGDMIVSEVLSGWLEDEIRAAYERLSEDNSSEAVAVRSSATAEDTESASLPG